MSVAPNEQFTPTDLWILFSLDPEAALVEALVQLISRL